MTLATRIIWLASLAAVVAQAGIYAGDLPRTLATHFDWSGNPNGWSSKTGFLFLWGVIILSLNLWVPLVPLLLRRTPTSIWSIPHRDYWLQDEAHKRTCMDKIATVIQVIMTLANLVCVLAFQIVVRHNLERGLRINPEILVSAVLVLVLISLSCPFLVLRKPEKDR